MIPVFAMLWKNWNIFELLDTIFEDDTWVMIDPMEIVNMQNLRNQLFQIKSQGQVSATSSDEDISNILIQVAWKQYKEASQNFVRLLFRIEATKHFSEDINPAKLKQEVEKADHIALHDIFFTDVGMIVKMY